MRPRTFKPGYHAWTEAEVALVFELRDDEGMDWPEIAAEIGGVNAEQVRNKYNNDVVRKRIASGTRFSIVPQATAIDCEKRASARQQQSLTSSICGDPAPGYSALDKRRRA